MLTTESDNDCEERLDQHMKRGAGRDLVTITKGYGDVVLRETIIALTGRLEALEERTDAQSDSPKIVVIVGVACCIVFSTVNIALIVALFFIAQL